MRHCRGVWADFFGRFGPVVRSVIDRHPGRFDWGTRQDIEQDVSIELVRKVSAIHQARNADGFVRKITQWRCKDEIGRQSRARDRLEAAGYLLQSSPGGIAAPTGMDERSPALCVARRESAEMLMKLLNRLEPDHASVLRLR